MADSSGTAGFNSCSSLNFVLLVLFVVEFDKFSWVHVYICMHCLWLCSLLSAVDIPKLDEHKGGDI